MVLRYVAWAVVPLIAMVELGAHFVFASRAPEPEAWHALRPRLTELRHDGELIVVAPYWAEPNARFALGDELMPLADVARADESRYARAIELSVAGESAPELVGWQSESEETRGKFRLRVLKNPNPQKPLFDFVAELSPEHASASTKQGDEFSDCPWDTAAKVTNGALDNGHPTYPKERFRCAGPEYNFVGVTVIEDHRYRPRRCIWAHPSESGATRVTYRDVPLGKAIHGYAALPYWLERWGKDRPIRIKVRVNDTEVGNFTHEDGQGWQAFTADTTAFAGQKHTVEFQISAKPNSRRQLCFQAETR